MRILMTEAFFREAPLGAIPGKKDRAQRGP